MSRRLVQRAPDTVSVADVSTLLGVTGLPDGKIARVPDLPPFAYIAANDLWVPAYLHPDYGTYTLQSHLRAADLSPGDVNDVVTADLPADWTITNAETGFVAQTANGLELTSGDGTAVTAESSAELAFTGLDDTTPADSDRIAIVARHAWADDGSLADSNQNRIDMSLRLSSNDEHYLWAASSGGRTGADGFSALMFGSGVFAGSTTIFGPVSRTEVWEAIVWQNGTNATEVLNVERFAGDMAGSVGVGRRSSATANVEAPNATWRAANSNGTDTSVVKIYVVDVAIFQQGV